MIAMKVLVLALLALLPGCAYNPVTGTTDIVLVSEAGEIEKGREMHKQIIQGGMMVHKDERLQAYVDEIGQRLASNSPRPDIEYTFTVIDNEEINAFALPGGYIYINRGLMFYMDNEAELAAVLAHEIGHVTARHAVRQASARATSQTLAGLAYIFTGSGSLANTASRYGASLVSGYGREHELEADREGAIYLHNSGYDPDAMLEVIGALKDHQLYSRAKAKEAGYSPRSYHGLFSTHPRHDSRLQEVIRAAGKLDKNPSANIDPAESQERFRVMTEGLAYGKSAPSLQRQGGRYYHNRLGFTFAYPEGWKTNQKSKSIVTQNGDKSAKVTLTMARKTDSNQSDRDFLGESLDAPRLFRSQGLKQAGLSGHIGVSPASDNRNSRRVAVLMSGSLGYLFEGTVGEEADFNAQDEHFMEVVESFRPMKRGERQSGKPQHLHWIQADENTTFAQLARQIRIPDAESQLRLMNGYYPGGEPSPGEWVKVIGK